MVASNALVKRCRVTVLARLGVTVLAHVVASNAPVKGETGQQLRVDGLGCRVGFQALRLNLPAAQGLVGFEALSHWFRLSGRFSGLESFGFRKGFEQGLGVSIDGFGFG